MWQRGSVEAKAVEVIDLQWHVRVQSGHDNAPFLLAAVLHHTLETVERGWHAWSSCSLVPKGRLKGCAPKRIEAEAAVTGGIWAPSPSMLLMASTRATVGCPPCACRLRATGPATPVLAMRAQCYAQQVGSNEGQHHDLLSAAQHARHARVLKQLYVPYATSNIQIDWQKRSSHPAMGQHGDHNGLILTPAHDHQLFNAKVP